MPLKIDLCKINTGRLRQMRLPTLIKIRSVIGSMATRWRVLAADAANDALVANALALATKTRS